MDWLLDPLNTISKGLVLLNGVLFSFKHVVSFEGRKTNGASTFFLLHSDISGELLLA